MSEKNKLKSSIKYPTSLIIRGNDFLAVEIAKSLIEQGGYVIVIDHDVEATLEKYKGIANKKLLTILDFSSVDYLEEDLRRLDYVFYLGHEQLDEIQEISSQEFLQASNYLDSIIKLTHKYEAKFLLTSSIRAHQILMERGEIDINYSAQNPKKQAVYTQMEIQRYSEALLLESIEKLKLNARIVRMGRVIGKGMSFSSDRSFDKLIFQAAKGKDLEVEADGLETNMYIHVLDASYGVIKAIFSKGTEGKIYSLSNEEEITDLSIAYKLQELVGQSSEIKFVESKSPLPPVRFYKPGINLSSIGWAPRVSFTRAISQTLDYAVELLIKDRKLKQKSASGDFHAQEGEENIEEIEEEPKGALARLIAERKAQENARRGSILMAGEKAHQNSKQKRSLTRTEKIIRSFQLIYDSIAYRLTFLKKVTIIEALFYCLLLMIFAIIYIGLISPIFVIGRNILVIEYYKKNLNKDLSNEDVQAVDYDIDKISSSVSSIDKSIPKLKVIFTIAGEEQKYNDLSNYVRYISLYAYQLNLASEQAAIFDSYWSGSNFGINYLPNSESVLSLSQADINTADSEKLKSYSTQIQANSQAITTASEELDQKKKVDILGYKTNSLISDLENYESKSIEIMNMIKNYNNMVLEETDAVYAVIIQDNSRFTPSGGYPAAAGYIHIQSGSVTDIYLKEIDPAKDSKAVGLTKSELDEIQLSSSSLVNGNSVSFSSLFLVQDRADLSVQVDSFYQTNYGVEPDAVFYLNLETLGNLLEITGPIDLNQVKIEKDSILNSINLLQGDDSSLQKRNEIITNIFAAEVNKILSDKAMLYKILPVLFEASPSGSAGAASSNVELVRNLTSSAETTRSKDWIEFFTVVDPEIIETKLYPSLNIKIKDYIDKNLSTQREVTLTKGGSQDIERVVICMPSSSKGFDLTGSESALGQAFLLDKICVAGDLSNSEVSFSYNLPDTVDNLSSGGYNKELEIISSPGLDLVYDYEASLASDFSIIEQEGTVISNQKVVEAGTQEGKKTITFNFTE